MAEEQHMNLNNQLVVIGSSAGGIEALSTLVGTLAPDFPAPIVIAQHLHPRRISHLQEILARRSRLPVRSVVDRDPLQAGVVYVVPSNRHVAITDHEIRVGADDNGAPKPSIDRLFMSAAQTFGEGLIAVVLTGTGSDGAAGARGVKDAGGVVVIQNPETASYPALPRSLAPSTIDVVANLESIGPLLYDLLTGAYTPRPPADDRPLRQLLEQLRERNGIDFSSYKMPTIMRRLQRRIVATGSDSLRAYVRYLQQHDEEYQRLVNSFLIKVTEFFRDAELFDELRTHILPELIGDARSHGNTLRIWSAGCATGEEAYSLAILLAEVLGDQVDAFNIRIFATDLDAGAVAFARRGLYPAGALVGLPRAYLDRYFSRVDDAYEVKKQIRAMIVFGQHDLGQRAPFPRIDLTLCRNVLIYFTTELQRRALQLFAFSLRDGGYLVLGKAETVSPLAELFSLAQPRLKIYRRIGDRVLIPPARIRDVAPSPTSRPSQPRRSHVDMEMVLGRAPRDSQRSGVVSDRMEHLLLRLPVGVVLVDRQYDIQFINGTARRLLEIHTPAVGDDLIHLISALPTGPLRGAIDRAFRGETDDVSFDVGAPDAEGRFRYVRLSCRAETIEARDGPLDTVIVLVEDVTAESEHRIDRERESERQRAEIERLEEQFRRTVETNRDLQSANDDLTTANAGLRNSNEELLVSNEEIQAATEEVETLNEELQATNEELETLNEELQATVEELNTTNDDLQARSVELQDLAGTIEEQRHISESERGRLDAVLSNMADAVVAVDAQGRQVFANGAYQRLFGDDDRLRNELLGVGGLPLADEAGPLQRAARGDTFTVEFMLPAEDGSQRWFEATGQPVRANRPALGVAVIREITDRSVRHFQDTFLSLASHELRTPLTALRGFLQILQREPLADTARTNRLATLALAQAERMATLIGSLLDVARLQSGRIPIERAPIDVSELAQNAVETARAIAQTPPILLELPEDSVRVNGDTVRLEQVLLNLLTNALTYAKESPSITVRVGRADGEAQIQVEDHGPGIAPDVQPLLFARFRQGAPTASDKTGQGLGLGLYISREIVTEHDGTITLDSTPGKGTTFTIRLPLLDAPSSS
ncbi:MAG: PAS domain-containing protein [Chloroflexi bacterium]|nr:PAS domain-containing protein [Chloroflexota bacterium]